MTTRPSDITLDEVRQFFDAFCLDFGEADTRAARERVEEAVLAVVPVPQPKKKED